MCHIDCYNELRSWFWVKIQILFTFTLIADVHFIYFHAYCRCSRSHIHSRFMVCLFGDEIWWMKNFRKKK